MVRLLETVDKTGKIIYLTDERYKHILKHPEMRNSLSLIHKAIISPQKTTAPLRDQNIRYFYTYHKNHKSSAKYLRVIVKYLNGKGFVITAYFVMEIV